VIAPAVRTTPPGQQLTRSSEGARVVAKSKLPFDPPQFPVPEQLRRSAEALRRHVRSLQPSPRFAAEGKLRAVEQERRRWRAEIEQALGPRWRDDPEWAREDQHWSEYCALLRAEIEDLRQQASKKPVQSQPQPKPKHAGGQSPKLTDEEISRLQAAYDAAQAKEKRKQSAVFKELRLLLPKHKRTISDRTLRRDIIESRS
jgi:hypothetical protein